MSPVRLPTAGKAAKNTIAGSLSSSLGTPSKAAPPLLLPGGAALFLRDTRVPNDFGGPLLLPRALETAATPSSSLGSPHQIAARRRARTFDGPSPPPSGSSEPSGGAPPPPWAPPRPFRPGDGPRYSVVPLLLPRGHRSDAAVPLLLPWALPQPFRPGNGPDRSAALSSSPGPLDSGGGASPPPSAPPQLCPDPRLPLHLPGTAPIVARQNRRDTCAFP